MNTRKVWFITGASRGFGAQIAREALSLNDFVVATGRNADAVENALGKDPKLLSLSLDVTLEEGAKQAMAAAVEHFGRVDILVNNAGYGLLGALEESSAIEVEKIFKTNVFGLLHVTRAALPQMRKQRSGHIINFSSLGGYVSYPGWGVYCATKFAVEGLTESLSMELAPLGINATVVGPGFFRTDFLNTNSLLSTESKIEDYENTAGKMRNFAEASNHRQPGDPLKLAKAITVIGHTVNPPLRLPLGSDAIQRLQDRNGMVELEVKRWRKLAESTDYLSETIGV